MNNKKILQMAQQESQDEGKLSEWRNMSIVHYIMLLVAWLFIFTIRLLKNESIDDLFFMLLLLALGHEIYLFKKKRSMTNIIVIVVLLIAVSVMGWNLMSGIFK
jgi:magnesium-transporting ATPase (P-type)